MPRADGRAIGLAPVACASASDRASRRGYSPTARRGRRCISRSAGPAGRLARHADRTRWRCGPRSCGAIWSDRSACRGSRAHACRGWPVTDLTLHDYELDDGCYKVRLLLGALGLAARQNCGRRLSRPRTAFVANILGSIRSGALPILVDGDVVLHGAEAILAYLARKYDSGRTWLPVEPALFGAVMHWLGFAGGELRRASLARLAPHAGGGGRCRRARPPVAPCLSHHGRSYDAARIRWRQVVRRHGADRLPTSRCFPRLR